MSNIITIENVRAYLDENGTAWLNLEDAARGLGFTRIANGKEYVRWERVNKYLEEFGFLPKGGQGVSASTAANIFIPENIFYKLSMKASNDYAKTFQAKVADEIIPTIRKTGTYSVHQTNGLTSTDDLVIMLATRNKQLAAQIVETQRQVVSVANRIEQVEAKIEKRLTGDYMLQIVNPSQVGKMFEPALSAIEINKRLQAAGLQWRSGGEWIASAEGKKYSSSEPVQCDDGEWRYHLKWQRRVKDLILEA